MTCSNCGAANDAGRKFCLSCGQRLAVACPSCGTPNPPEARFCGECGTDVTANATPLVAATTPASTAPSTERRLVSILFADLVGFTTLSEGRDAEDVRELLASYFDTSRSIVERYGGTVEKFIGDAVMAVWGTPVAQEDDAERAVRAALELVDAVRRIGSERSAAELALRAAVHTGEAVVTIGASGMGMVAGDLVNTASRLQSVAEPGTVLVGDGTRRAASNAIAFEPIGEQELKGKTSPVPAFRALRVVAQRGGIGRSEALEPPFVGRDAELQLIKDFYHATARDRGPRLVSVIGQAGIGKSRLAWEFLKYIDGVTEVVYWHQGRSPAYGEGISFWALGEMVRMRIGAEEGADEATTRSALARILDEFVRDTDERRTIEPAILHLLGIGDAPPSDRGQLFAAWRAFFERIAEAGPVVMVFEDLQWADEGLLDFIEELMAWSRGRSIYVITLARPDLVDRRPTWGAGVRSFTSLSLAPLSDADLRALLEGLVPGLPEAAVASIVGRAEGVPLFAVETVRTLLNDGRIERVGEVFRPSADLSDVTVPESLHALIAARIDALPADERTLIQDASVLGLSFAAPALEAVSRSALDDIGPMLQHLLRRELLVIDDDPRSPERGHHRFVQGFLREVAYGTLSRDDRRARHLAAARYYEALGDDELSGVLAQHYVDAYEAHPDGPEGAAVAAQARVALKAAAVRAKELGSPGLAHAYLESAIRVTRDPTEELELQGLACTTSFLAGRLEASEAHGRRALELTTVLNLPAARRLATADLARVLIEGHQQSATELLEQAMAEPGLLPTDEGYLELAAHLSRVVMRSLHEERAVEIADAALRDAPQTDDLLVLDIVITRSVALSNLGRTTEALAGLYGAYEMARRLDDPELIGRAGTNLGYALVPENLRGAYDISRDAYERVRRAGNISSMRYLLGNIVDSAVELGEWDWAVEQMAEVEHLFVEPMEQLWMGAYRAVISALRGADIHADAQRYYEASRSVDDPQVLALGAYALMFEAFLGRDRRSLFRLVKEASENNRQGAVDFATIGVRAALWEGDLGGVRDMLVAPGTEQRGRRTDALRAAMDAGLAQLEGRTGDARQLFAEAQRIMREQGMALWLAMTDLDVVITGAMEPAERHAAAEEARGILTRLKATPLLERLEQAHQPERSPAARVSEGVEQEA